MKRLIINIFSVLILSFYCLNTTAQDSLVYRLDAFSSVSTGDFTPFWIVNNTHGVVPLQSNNIYGRGDLCWNHQFGKEFKLKAELDLVGASKHSSSFYIQQLYASLSYKALNLSVGAKEYYDSMLDSRLSVGDFNYSPNARPIPEINLSVPEFTKVPFTKGILQFKGDFAVGRSTDSHYIERTKYPGETYTIDILWHHKSLSFNLEDPDRRFPLTMEFGFVHAAQWGGWTSYYNQGEVPHSFSDFIRIVLGQGGGEDAMEGEQINALGNHQGVYNLKFGYKGRSFDIFAYKQHYFDDNSGVEYANWRDGIWGLEARLNNQNYLKKMVFEYFNTTNQSGPMHFLDHTRPNTRGGGNDDYYNHDIYISGWSHWGRTLGNPLITSPEYDKNGKIYFQNNRVQALHWGFEGEITPEISYRVLATGMYAWGRMSYPFLGRKNDFSSLLECSYTPSRGKGWKFIVQTAFDGGSLYNDNFGFSLKISKSGLIRF